MKIIINENERGLLFKDGMYVQLLAPGKHNIWGISGKFTVQKVKAEGRVLLEELNPKLLLKDQAFADAVTSITVPDNHIAMHFVDGRLRGSLAVGEYFFWNVLESHTFELLDVSTPEVANIPKEYFLYIPIKQYTKVEVLQGECVLLYFNNALERVLESGLYYFWNTSTKISVHKVDMRTQQMEIAGQEILTADKVALRINFVCSFQITNAVRMVSELKDFSGQLYSNVQLALRKYVGAYRLDELLVQKDEIASFILSKLKAEEEQLFVEFKGAGIKDIILPGEIRAIMNTVLVAEKTAQANVISRREEVASTRSLLNTAKLLDENETLRRLKEMEYMERICDKVGNISVSNGGNLLVQLQELIGVK